MTDTKDPGSERQREFVLAGTIFVLLAIVGTAFGLWMVFRFKAGLPHGQQVQPPPPTAASPRQ